MRCIKDNQAALIERKINNARINLYPSPYNDYINIDAKGDIVNRIDLFSPDGKLIIK